MNKLFFIIGMRRSGTSILRKIVMRNSQVKNIEFEPNELLEITERIDIPRYRNIPFFKNTLERFKEHSDKYYGAKLALNPGIEAMRWLNLPFKFPNAKFIFIRRTPKSTYNSWINIETSKRGLCSYQMYLDWWTHINVSFLNFEKSKRCIIDYEKLIKNPDIEMFKIWKFLKVPRIYNLKNMIKTPKYGC